MSAPGGKASSGRRVYALIVGVGGVGTQVISQLAHLRKSHPYLCIPLIANSQKALRVPLDRFAPGSYDCVNLDSWQKDLDATSTRTRLVPEALLNYGLCITATHKAVLVDNTSSVELAKWYPRFLSAGISVATPNKKGFSDSLQLWTDIFSTSHDPTIPERANNGLVYHESTVGAGLPIISTLNDLIQTGDRVVKVEGVFSGTMSFLFNTFAPAAPSSSEKPSPWSAVVKKAKEAGFTEPDPRDDLNGIDVARKLVILARIAGLDVETFNSFPVQSLIPDELQSCQSGDEFLEKLDQHDGQMEKIKQDADAAGKVVRFVGSIDMKHNALKVGLEDFDRGHPIAGLKGSDNIVSFYTERYGSNPLVIQGAGAGGAVTAMGVTADILKILQRLR